jgi:hypothetical protein
MKRPPVTWNTLDWPALERLRDTFLTGEPRGANYWTSRSDLENYDLTFAQRIAWKWDAVLRELKMRGWTPPSGGALLDWGCGSGIAGRQVVEFYGSEHFTSLHVFDRSPLAMEYSLQRARETFPSLRTEPFPDTPLHDSPEHRPPVRRGPSPPNAAGSETGAPSVGTVVISHVLNELDEAGGHALRQVIDRADAVLWVEPGTYASSRSLIAMHEALRETFNVIAPCTHKFTCGLRTPVNERHWCHHFASPPAGIMADSNWVRFAEHAGIDLRSLPYSFLVLERKGLREPVPGLLPDGYSRIIGAPRLYKGYAKIFSCQADGVRDLTLQKRDAPGLFKALKGCNETGLYQWEIRNGRIERFECF